MSRHGKGGLRLRKRIYAHLLIVLIVGIVASGLVFTTGWRREFMHASASRLARHVAAQIADDYMVPDARLRAVRRISEELDADLTVRDLDGRLLVSAGTPFNPLLPESRARILRGEIVVEHQGRFYVAAPILVDGRVVGVLEASPMARSFPAPSLFRPLLMIALVMLIAGVASGPLARRISLPIERLTAAVRSFGGGDLSARVTTMRKHRWRRHHYAPDELEQLTRAFNEMADRIERMVRGQKELLANISHELRSPLARIRVALELLPRDAKNEARLRDVEADLIELDRLIEDVLTTARLDASGLPTHVEPVDLGELLRQLAARAEHDPATAGKPVRASGGAGIIANADGALLKRALWNLVENAAKYGAPPIEIEAAREDGSIALRVRDAGAGVAPEERERIFEPFYRSDKARTPGNGFGLGLTLARRVAEVHGGTISVDGATFTLKIPA
jgi:signal transduction histidine kinase